VYVSVAYRAGVLGWPWASAFVRSRRERWVDDTKHSVGKEFQDEHAENLGLRDVILSLEWVQENIHAFGGDSKKVGQITPAWYQFYVQDPCWPLQVTVVGISAGSDIISLLYLQPKAGSLFRSAVGPG
jgi:carboxylesterase type B